MGIIKRHTDKMENFTPPEKKLPKLQYSKERHKKELERLLEESKKYKHLLNDKFFKDLEEKIAKLNEK